MVELNARLVAVDSFILLASISSMEQIVNVRNKVIENQVRLAREVEVLQRRRLIVDRQIKRVEKGIANDETFVRRQELETDSSERLSFIGYHGNPHAR